MKHLQKTWARILISLFGGGFVQEIIHVLQATQIDLQQPTYLYFMR